ncbi:MAG: sugar ABC transporter permease [Oscillospiraceae bacterium]|nr:sugar ABC transporter permease [Oscillospiraceae bacterium]
MKIPYERRKSLYGYGFISIWLIGTVLWFLIPLAESLCYCFMDNKLLKPDTGGMRKVWLPLSDGRWLENFRYVFAADPKFKESLIAVLKDTLIQTPMILIFSLFIAVVLNQKFRGRGFARAIFFLPVIIATGPVYNIISGNIAATGADSGVQFSTLFETDLVGDLLDYLGVMNISSGLTDFINAVVTNIFGLVWSSGIQILIFLAALQNIPVSAKEAASMEGATAWEYFWKITLPYVSPMILANFIYTVIDSFTRTDNAVMMRVLDKQQVDWDFAYASAMVWSYFAIVMAVVGVVVLIVNRFVFYEVE